VEEDAVIYDATPEYMGQIAAKLRGAGARIVGGCCGTTPEHLAAMAQALHGQSNTHPLAVAL
jgi:methionine synthase I (cobalamin-dependent)